MSVLSLSYLMRTFVGRGGWVGCKGCNCFGRRISRDVAAPLESGRRCRGIRGAAAPLCMTPQRCAMPEINTKQYCISIPFANIRTEGWKARTQARISHSKYVSSFKYRSRHRFYDSENALDIPAARPLASLEVQAKYLLYIAWNASNAAFFCHFGALIFAIFHCLFRFFAVHLTYRLPSHCPLRLSTAYFALSLSLVLILDVYFAYFLM